MELDPITGNYRELSPNPPIEYLAFLKQGKLTESSSSKSFYNTGIDEGAIEFTGYLVDPMFFPEDTRFPVDYPCEVRFGNGDFIKGNITLRAVIGSAVNADEITGQPIAGVWRNI